MDQEASSVEAPTEGISLECQDDLLLKTYIGADATVNDLRENAKLLLQMQVSVIWYPPKSETPTVIHTKKVSRCASSYEPHPTHPPMNHIQHILL